MGPKRKYEVGAQCPFGCGSTVRSPYDWKTCHWDPTAQSARCISRQKQVAAYHSAPHQHGVDTPNFMESNAVDQQSFSDNASIIVRDNEMSRPTFPTQAEGANVFSNREDARLGGLDKVITRITENGASNGAGDSSCSETSSDSDSDTSDSDSNESVENYSQEPVLSRIEKMRSELVFPDNDGDETRNYNVKELALFLQLFQAFLLQFPSRLNTITELLKYPQHMFPALLRSHSVAFG